MKYIKNLFVLVISLMAGMSLVGCADDIVKERPISNGRTIIGEWLEVSAEGNFKTYGTSKYNQDNTVDMWLALLDVPSSFYYNYAGTYTLDGNTLTQKYANPMTGENVTEVYTVDVKDKYTMTITAPKNNSTSTAHRVVDTYEVKVGERRSFFILDSYFSATSYQSTDESIARVEADGTIIAVRRGLAFISATSSAGTAVIRVVVTDPNNYIDDFMSFMGGSINDVTAVYGNDYIETQSQGVLTERTYALLDERIENVIFGYASGKVLTATATVREGVDKDAIFELFNKRYTPVSVSKTSGQYSTVKDGQKYAIYYFPGQSMVVYMIDLTNPDDDDDKFSDEDYKQYESLLLMGTADAAADYLGHGEFTEEELEDGYFDYDIPDNEIFSSLTVMFNEDPDDEEYMQITTIQLMTKANISKADIEEWYKEHYQVYNELNYYNDDPRYYIYFREKGARCFVYYSFRPTKK